MSDGIQGEWETREVYGAGERLIPSESLAVARHSPDGFAWGDGGSGAVQLALALLLRATDRASAATHYQAFKWEVIARLPQAGFTLALSTVRDWLATRSAPRGLRPNRHRSPARATMHHPPSAGRAADPLDHAGNGSRPLPVC